MNTRIVKTKQNTKEDIYEEAADILRSGGLVAFPTETVYGLGGNALDANASRKIYAAKGRPSDNPLIVHISSADELKPLVKEIPDVAKKLMEAFWPGPMTLIFKKSDIVPHETTGGLDTVAIRMPSHPVANKLIKTCKVPIAAPSANASGRPSPTTAEHVIEDLDGRVDMIIDGGSSEIGLESTIIDVSGNAAEVLRPGYISPEDIDAVIGKVDIDKTTLSKPEEGARPKAPGMKYRHYAPKAPLTIFVGESTEVIDKINERIRSDREEGKTTGCICTKENEKKIDADVVLTIGSRDNEKEIAHNLFGVLREFDKKNVDVIYSEGFDASGIGFAIMNRMLKAAGYNIIKV